MVRIIDKIIQRRKQSITQQYVDESSTRDNNGTNNNNNNNNSRELLSDNTTDDNNNKESTTTPTAATTTSNQQNKIYNPNWYYSFEFFPPKTEAGLDNLLTRIDRMVQRLDPLFIDITWSNYTTAANTMVVATQSQKFLGVDVLLHLSTVNITKEQIIQILHQAKISGIQNILVLRGDPPKGKSSWLPNDTSNGHCPRAIDLVKLIRQLHGNYFGIAVAGHPEGHPSSTSIHDEMIHLKEKIDAGADFIITQLFYNVSIFIQFVYTCRQYGITCPIIPGIMPIQSYSSFQRMTQYCQIHVPDSIWELLNPIKDDDEAIKRIGCQIATNMCREILTTTTTTTNNDYDIDGIHFYTLNLERSVTYILNELGAIDVVYPTTNINNNNTITTSSNNKSDTTSNQILSLLPTDETVQDKNFNTSTTTTTATTTIPAVTFRATSGRTLPWRPSAIERRHKNEHVRPINWANRPKSYVVRTEDWDEYPNGRWGDSASPAFGELSGVSHFYSFSLGDEEDQRAMLGHQPKEHSDIYEVFARYVEGTIPHIPWCETPLQPESFLIQTQLAQLNRSGFLTINSQPSVNGVPSSHKTFGWGGPGGYIYQKAYCECFCSPENTKRLVEMVKQHKSMNLYAVNTMGDQIQEGIELGGITALTWGVFPNREILQPTIFDPHTFLVWSEEAFSLWTYMWMNLYELDSPSYNLIENIRDTYYLCAIIDNDYISKSTIWDAIQVAGST